MSNGQHEHPKKREYYVRRLIAIASMRPVAVFTPHETVLGYSLLYRQPKPDPPFLPFCQGSGTNHTGGGGSRLACRGGFSSQRRSHAAA